MFTDKYIEKDYIGKGKYGHIICLNYSLHRDCMQS